MCKMIDHPHMHKQRHALIYTVLVPGISPSEEEQSVGPDRKLTLENRTRPWRNDGI